MAPDLPTLAESGYPKLVAENFFGISGPAGLPRNVVDSLNRATQTVLDDPKLQKSFADLGIVTAKMTPEQFTSFVQKQVSDWGPAVKASGAKLN
jgi:tripartite-type tricarboxylate transporter receptor subunit TctC